MSELQSFSPDWASPPGDTIRDILEDLSLPTSEFAVRTGQTPQEAVDLLTGTLAVSKDVAARVAAVVGGSPGFWLSRDAKYRQALASSHRAAIPDTSRAWLAELPLNDLCQFGWIARSRSPATMVSECLRFFDVPDIDTWRTRYGTLLEQVTFRSSPTFDSQPAAVAAWIRRGELEADAATCERFSAKALEARLADVKALTRTRKPQEFLPTLEALCATCGVAMVIARAPAGCRASGATKFIRENKALLLLSFRHLTDDHFWFTVFHELGHILLHSRDAVFVEGDGQPESREEQEANEFAASTLLPEPFRTQLSTLALNRHDIRHFAKAAGIAPGIVVGQLQHTGRANPTQLNALKVRYSWTGAPGRAQITRGRDET